MSRWRYPDFPLEHRERATVTRAPVWFSTEEVSVSIRLRAGRPARILRSLSAVAVAAGAAAAMPSAANAAAADLTVVAAKTATSKPDVPAVLNLRLKNAATTAYDPHGPNAEASTKIEWQMPSEWPRYSASVRSAHGWNCVVETSRRGFCALEHQIPAGGASLPVELELLPDLNEVPDTYAADVWVQGSTLQIPAGGGKPDFVQFPVTGDRGSDPEGLIPFSFPADGGLGDHPRAPKVAATVDKPELTGTEQGVATFSFASAGTISTGPFNWKVNDWDWGTASVGTTAWNGEPAEYPNVKLGITLPADKVVLDDIKFYGLLPEQVGDGEVVGGSVGIAATSTAPAFGDAPIEPSRIEKNTEKGEYLVTLPTGVRLLTDHPVRVVATVHLQPGVDGADLVGEVSAPADAIGPIPSSTGRALLGGLTPPAATATVSVKRAKPPVVKDPEPTTPQPTTPTETTPEPTTPVTPAQTTQSTQTPAPAPAPDQGAVLAARAAPKLTGRARFAKPRIYVGRQTNLTLTVDNVGNAASESGEVCTKLSRHIVVVKLPKGVTVQGSKLCAKRSALQPAGKLLAAKGIVVRGVVATSKATAIDGVNDGVALVGDRLQVAAVPSRGGGVTG